MTLRAEHLQQFALDAAERAHAFVAATLSGVRSLPFALDPEEDPDSERQLLEVLRRYRPEDAGSCDQPSSAAESSQAQAFVPAPLHHDEALLETMIWAVLSLDADAAIRNLAQQPSLATARAHAEWTGEEALSTLLQLAGTIIEVSADQEPRRAAHATLLRRLVRRLARSQRPDGRWLIAGSAGSCDPILTGLALLWLRHAGPLLASLPVRLDDAVAALTEDQATDGAWPDRSGLEASVPATAVAALALLVDGTELEVARCGIAWLIATQEQDGGWQIDPRGKGQSSSRATHLAILALDAFARCHRFARTGGAATEVATGDLYSLSRTETWHGLPRTRPLDHTMFRALDRYAEEKLPARAIERTLLDDGAIEVHGIYPEHFASQAATLGLAVLAEIDFDRKPKSKRYNRVRPRFFEARRGDRKVVAAAVIPGADYFFHYATLIRHYVHGLTEDPEAVISLARYPIAERRLANWTGLDARFVRPGDRVLLGYVEAIAALLEEQGATRIDFQENDYYGSDRFRLRDGSVLNLLGVKYSYWGSISGTLVESLCHRGAAEILYVAKLGTLSSPDHIYSRIFVPGRFYLLHRDVVIREVRSPRNAVLAQRSGLSTGVHVSIPTVLEEDYRMRRTATRCAAQSIDNEISQMAEAVAVHNAIERADVAFSAIHMATDYIRDVHERALPTRFDLGNDKTAGARSNKQEMIHRIANEVLFPYLDVGAPA